jgi:hypothetical protein
VDRRRRARAAAAVTTTLLLAACANDPAAYPHGEQATSPTDGSLLRTLVVFVGVPLLIVGVLALLSWLPGMVRAKRYRPQQGWSAAPVWFAGPSGDALAAVHSAQTGDVTRGGSGGSW